MIPQMHTQSGYLTTFQIQGDGRLRISLTDAGQEEIDKYLRQGDERGTFAAFDDLLEEHLRSDDSSIFGWVRPHEIGALTDDTNLLIGWNVERDYSDDADPFGAILEIDGVWHYPRYAVDNELEILKEYGSIIFEFVECGPVEEPDS